MIDIESWRALGAMRGVEVWERGWWRNGVHEYNSSGKGGKGYLSG